MCENCGCKVVEEKIISCDCGCDDECIECDDNCGCKETPPTETTEE
jgi:hypothetical protein